MSKLGQYFKIANLDKKEFLHPNCLGGGLKLWEMCASRYPSILPYLLSSEEIDGTGIQQEPKYLGRWYGDRIAVVGDYASDNLYDEISDNYRNISHEVVQEFNAFIDEEDLKLPTLEDMKQEEKQGERWNCFHCEHTQIGEV